MIARWDEWKSSVPWSHSERHLKKQLPSLPTSFNWGVKALVLFSLSRGKSGMGGGGKWEEEVGGEGEEEEEEEEEE